MNVSERVKDSNLDSLLYSIRLGSFADQQAEQIIDNPVLQSYGLERLNDIEDRWIWFTGKFLNRKSAEMALIDIQTRTDFKGIRIVKRIKEQPDLVSGSK